MNEETSVLTNRQLGFEIKAANNMIRRKIDTIFAQMEGNEINGMQGPLLGYLYHKTGTAMYIRRMWRRNSGSADPRQR